MGAALVQAAFDSGRLQVETCKVANVAAFLHVIRTMDFYSLPSLKDVPFNAIVLHHDIYEFHGWRRGHYQPLLVMRRFRETLFTPITF